MEQNYFQYNKQCYKPKKGIAMGSPLSGYLAEIYIQEIEETDVKHTHYICEICSKFSTLLNK
jgi:hypothetical protein